jgi:hypothetical protein
LDGIPYRDYAEAGVGFAHGTVVGSSGYDARKPLELATYRDLVMHRGRRARVEAHESH